MNIKHSLSLCLTLAAIALSSCTQQKDKPVSMTMCCDESFRNIMEQEIAVFEYRMQKEHVLCEYTTEKVAFDSLFQGKTKTIVVGRDLTADEKKSLTAKKLNPRSQKIAVDAVALIVNNENPVNNVTMSDLKDILTGNITDWEGIPAGVKKHITVVFDSDGSGLAYYMRDKVLNGGKFGKNVIQVGSVEKVFEAVKERPGAIGVIGVSWLTKDLEESNKSVNEIAEELSSDAPVDGGAIDERMENSGVKTLGLIADESRAYRPYQQYIYDGRYPLTRPIYMITVASPAGIAGHLYAFVGGVDGQRLIMRTGILPARVPIDIVDLGQ